MSASDLIIQRRVFVTGKVQGVSFRASTMRMAHALGSLKGFVRNLKDGRVEAVFQGRNDAVLKAVAWCRSGPPASRVDGLEVIEESVQSDLPDFTCQNL